MRARTRRFWQRPIRTLLSLVIAVPIACLLVLWAFAMAVTVSAAGHAHDFSTSTGLYGGTGQALYSALSAERLQTVAWLSGGRQSPPESVQAAFQTTDKAANAFLVAATASRGAIPGSASTALNRLASALAGRGALRAGIGSGRVAAPAAFSAYSAMVGAELEFDGRLLATSDGSLNLQAAASVQASRAVDLASQEVALLYGADAAGGTMSTADRVQFAQDVAAQRLLIGAALGQLRPGLSRGYERAVDSAVYRSFASIEDQIVASAAGRGPIPVRGQLLDSVTTTLIRDYEAAEQQDQSGLSAQAAQTGRQLAVAAWIVVVLGLAAIVCSVGLAIRFGLRISRELTRVQAAALELASDLQPSPADRPADGADAALELASDVQPSPADRPADGADAAAVAVAGPEPAIQIWEIARISDTLSAAHRTAARTVADQGQARSRTRQAILNLAAHSQALLRRQQALLDEMQQAAGEPVTSAELSAMDQLTTRMRRHADGLLVLSGGSPGRAWPGPLPIGDLLGVVATEVGDVARVTAVADSHDEVTGAAAADVVHLIAELAAAAAERTPPGGEVAIRAGRVGRGLAVEIEDRGAELDAAAVERVNALLASPPEFDVVETDQLAYVVAARLAAKHRITVTVRSSPFGGTAAILVLPHAILVAGSDRDTIVDGSLPRIDVRARQPEPWPQAPEPRETESQAGLADSRVAPYAAADEDPAAAKPAPWYWLTASPPATEKPASAYSRPAPGGSGVPEDVRSAADPPTIVEAEAGLDAAASGGMTAAGLPRRVRQASFAPGVRSFQPDSAADEKPPSE